MDTPTLFDSAQLAERWPQLTRREAHEVMTAITSELRDLYLPPPPAPTPRAKVRLGGLDGYLAALLGDDR